MNIHPLNDIDSYEAPKKQKPSETLEKAIQFSENDLALNQHGTMSASQQWEFRNRRDTWAIRGIVGVLGSLVLWFGGRDLWLLLVLFGIGIVVCGVNAYNHHVDARQRTAAVLEGRINLNINGRRFSLLIGDFKFDVKQKVFLAFKNGDPYRVYYAPHTRKILSAECLRD